MPRPSKAEQAEYMRQYRATTKPLGERKAANDGVKSGIDRCIRYLRESVGGKAITGYVAALMIERSMIENEPAESEARRKFVDGMRIR